MLIRNIQVRVLVAAVAALGVSASVMAGVRQTIRTVIVDQTNRFAEGHSAGARASNDSTQFIGCAAWAQDSSPDQNGGTFRQGLCWATDVRGISGFCMTSEPELLAVMATLQGDSLVNFNWNANNTCIHINVRQASSYEPKR